MQLTLKVLNIWGRPCSGKSTLAAALFNIMKSLDQKVELVTEYAKDLTYEKNFGTLENQLKVFAEQDARLRRLEGQVEWAITDSPLGLGEVYMTDEYSSWLPDAMRGAYHRYDNWDVWVHGVKKYQQYGRTQSEPAALALDAEIKATRPTHGMARTPSPWRATTWPPSASSRTSYAWTSRPWSGKGGTPLEAPLVRREAGDVVLCTWGVEEYGLLTGVIYTVEAVYHPNFKGVQFLWIKDIPQPVRATRFIGTKRHGSTT
jgi:energy-coupling factor transporter ATP-binding protein EcfA2